MKEPQESNSTLTFMTLSGRKVRCALTASILGSCLLMTDAHAGGRPADPSRDWWMTLSGGVGTPTDNTVDTGWTIGGGAMYWPEKWKVGLVFDLNYTDFTFSRETLDTINDIIDDDPDNRGSITGGDLSNLQLSVNGIWGPGRSSNGLYFTAGISANYMEAEVTQTGLVYYPPFCDPWYWWWCVPGGIGIGDFTAGKESDTHFGYNAGVGWNIDTPTGQLYFEAKYQVIDTGDSSAGYVPITFGIRF